MTGVPAGALVQVFFRSPGQPESVAENTILGSGQNTGSSTATVTFGVYGVPSTPGYLEAEAYTSSGTLDSAEVPINGLTPPTGDMPEVPWAVVLPPILLAGLGVVRMKRSRRLSER